MKHTMRILTLLMLAIVVGTGQTWGRGGGLGYIVFDDSEVTNKGEVAFYTDAECTEEISFSGGKTDRFSSVGMHEEMDGNNLLGYTIYIKAVPNYNYTFGAADDNGAVTFITAEKTTNIFQAPRRTQSDPTINVGHDIAVKATDKRYVYSFVMPANGANVTVHYSGKVTAGEIAASASAKIDSMFAVCIRVERDFTLIGHLAVIKNDVTQATPTPRLSCADHNGQHQEG